MDTAPNARNPGLVGGIVIGGPLQSDGYGGAVLKAQNIVGVGAEATGEERGTGKPGQEFRRGTAEGAVAGDVARERWCDKVCTLIGAPGLTVNPFHAAVISRVRRRTRPIDHHNLSRGQAGVASRGDGGRCDQFDEVGDERKAIGMIAGGAWIGGLAESRQVANGSQGTPAIVTALDSPGSARGVVNRSIEGKVHLRVPF